MTASARHSPFLRRAVGLATLVAATAAPALAAASPASAMGPGTSSIASRAVHSCLDTSTTDPAHYLLDIYGSRCTGSAPQTFTFTPVAGAAAGTYQVGTSAPGQCVVTYRFGLRQAACLATPNPSYDEWTLQPVGATGRDYRLALASGGGCLQADPKPHGYPGALFTVHACTGAANQVFTLAAGLA